MPLEQTSFNSMLVKSLWYDVVFRIVIWVLLALVAAYFIIKVDHLPANQYFINQTHLIARVVNIVGVVSLYIGLFAFMFKDFEVIYPATWGTGTRLNWLGGFVRRVAGDLALWTLSAFVSVVTAVTVAGALTTGETPSAWALFTAAYLLILLITLVTAGLTVFLRRKEPLFARGVNDPGWLGWIYACVILSFPMFIMRNHM